MTSDWPVRSVAECASGEAYATQIGPFGDKIRAETYVAEGLPVLRGLNCSDGLSRFRDEDFVFVPREKLEEYRPFLCKSGDVVLVHKGTLGKVGLIPENACYPVYVMGNSMMRVRCNETTLLPQYLYYWLSSKYGRDYLYSRISQVGVPQLQRPLSSLREAKIECPPVEEQRAICGLLSALDDKIELNRRMNQTLEEICRALFNFWFVDFGPARAKADGTWKKGESLPGMPADMWDLWPSEFEESEIGEIPNGWDVRPLAEVADISQGSTPSTEIGGYWDPPGHDWVTVKDLSQTRDCVLIRTDRKVSQTGFEFLGSKVVPSGSILLSTGAPIGYVAIPTVPVVLGTRVAALQPRSPLGQSYMLHWTRANIQAFRDAANGTTFPQLLLSTLREFPILVPSAQALSRFEALLSSAHARTVVNVAESVGLAATRDVLLPKLLSGEIRVPIGTGT